MFCSTVLAEKGGKPKITCQEKSACLYVGGMDFPTPSKQNHTRPTCFPKAEEAGRALCVSFPTSICVLCQQLQVGRGKFGSCSWWGVMTCTGLGEVTLMGGMGRSWLPCTHTWMPQSWRGTGKHELCLHCPCPK